MIQGRDHLKCCRHGVLLTGSGLQDSYIPHVVDTASYNRVAAHYSERNTSIEED